MSFNLFALAIALALDAFIIAISYSFIIKKDLIRHAFIYSVFAGFFQFLMPLVGYFIIYLIGQTFVDIVKQIDHFIVFFVFSYLGYKFIKESNSEIESNSFNFATILSLTLASSIDAMAAGFLIYTQKMPLATSTIIIGIFAFFLSFVGFFIKNYIKFISQKLLQIIGGLILIVVGLHTLIEHIRLGI